MQELFPTQARAIGKLEALEALRAQRIGLVEVFNMDGVAVAQVEHERAWPEFDGVLVYAGAEDQYALVGAGAAAQRVGVLAADQYVVAGHAPDVVVALEVFRQVAAAAVDQIVPGAAERPVAARAAIQRVIAADAGAVRRFQKSKGPGSNCFQH